MLNEVVIFGAGGLAEVARYYFELDGDLAVVAHTVDAEYLRESSQNGLPVVAFEEVRNAFPPERYLMFVAVGSQRVNQVRANRFLAARELGYDFASYVSSRAAVMPGLKHGPNTLIVEGSVVGPFVRVGSNVFILGSHIHHHCVIGDHCTLAAATLAGNVRVGSYTFIGLNASVSQSVSIGERNVIGDGAVIRQSTKPYAVYRPAATRSASFSSDRLAKLG